MRFELDHLVLNVRDMEAMLAFYLGTLGLAPHRVDEYREGRALFPCARVSEGTLVDLLPRTMWDDGSDAAGRAAPNLNHFCLVVDAADWDALMARVAAAGIEPEAGPMTLAGARGDGTSVYVRDPDGNRVELRHYPPPR